MQNKREFVLFNNLIEKEDINNVLEKIEVNLLQHRLIPELHIFLDYINFEDINILLKGLFNLYII